MRILSRLQQRVNAMRGEDRRQDVLFSYLSTEERIPADHPLRAMRALVEPCLAALSPRFDTMYSDIGRPSIPPEQLLRALLLQILFTIRSERQLMEQLNYNLLFRWFVGLTPDEPVWVPTVFTKNREPAAGRWARTRASTQRTSSTGSGGATRRPTWRPTSTRRNRRVRSMAGQRGTRDSRSVNGNASWLRKGMAGERCTASSANCDTGAARRWAGSLP